MRILRKLMMVSAMGMLTMGAYAVPAKRGLFTVKQSDGTQLTVQRIGDEHFHLLATEDGLSVGRSEDGLYYYRSAEGLTDVKANNPTGRSAQEKAFLQENMQVLGVDALIKANQSKIKARKEAPKKVGATQVPNQGSPRVPIILVAYKDYAFKDKDPNATFTDFFETGEVSAHQYLVDQSNGKYTPQFDVYGPYTLPNNRRTYGGNDVYGNDKGVGQMVAEGCLGLDDEIDFSKYDNDGDGECDVVIVLYAGDGEASSYDNDSENAVWPCQWDISSSDYGKTLRLDNTVVNRFAVFNELNGIDLSRIDGIGTFCHEFSHCLGLPDFYDTQYGPHFGMAHWSLMDYGCYNNDGYTPIGYSAYEKEFMGWLTIPEATENTYYTLPVFNQGSIDTDQAVKLTNPKDKNEYYILENRANQGWDKYMPAEGLMITHVTYNATSWSNNVVNDYDLQRMTIIPADNNLKLDKVSYSGETYYNVNEEDLKGDLWPYKTATELTDTSVPAAKVNTGGTMGKPLTDIAVNADGTISFWAMKAPLPSVAMPHTVSHKTEGEDAVTFYWNAGDENDVTYTLELKEHKDVTCQLVSQTLFNSDDHGWDIEGFAEYEAAGGGVRLGSNKKAGYLISPTFRTDEDGVVTVVVKAKYYSGDNPDFTVALIMNNDYADVAEFTLSSDYKDYVAVLHGAPSTNFNVEIGVSGSSKRRAYVSEATIYTGDATEAVVSSRTRTASGDAQIFEYISGTSHTVTGLTRGTVYDCRIKAVPFNPDSFTESPWSEVYTFTFDSGTGVAVAPADNNEDDFFNLQGMPVRGELTPGVYIRRNGQKVEKVIIK